MAAAGMETAFGVRRFSEGKKQEGRAMFHKAAWGTISRQNCLQKRHFPAFGGRNSRLFHAP